MDLFVLVLLMVSGAAIVGILFQAMTGKRQADTVHRFFGFWKPPQVPEDEWEKWGKN